MSSRTRAATVMASPEPPPGATSVADRPLPGLPIRFEGQPCRTCGSYEDPERVGLHVCEILGIVDHHQVLGRIPAEERGRC